MIPPPPPPPLRAGVGAFHYHSYLYGGDLAAPPFQLSAGPLPVGQPLYSLRRDLDGLQAWGVFNGVPNIAVTPIAALPGGGQTIGLRDTLMLSMGPGLGVVNAPAVVITGGVHAREWIAVEFVYLLAEYLVRNYTNIPVNRYQRAIKSLVDSRRIYIIPMLNPDGNMQTVFGGGAVNRLWRKNRRVLPVNPPAWVALLTNGLPPGNNNPPPFQNVVDPGGGLDATYDVPTYDPDNNIPPALAPPAGLANQDLANNIIGVDPNRNCTTPAWGYDGQRFPPAVVAPVPSGASDPTLDPYFGPAVASEVETRNLEAALAHAAAAPGISTSIDYHSYGGQILYPSETAHNGAVGPDYTVLGMTLRQLVSYPGTPAYRLGTPRQIINADATATIIDRAAQAHQSRAFTIELDPWVAPGVPLAAAGFLLNENQIMTVFEKNIRGALAALAAPGHPANWFTAYFQALPMAWNMLQFMTWDVVGRGNQLPLLAGHFKEGGESMPPAPPNRPNALAFHYHTYEYPGDVAAGAFQLSGALASAGNLQFHSLVQDLNGLVAWGTDINNVNRVPNLAVNTIAAHPAIVGGAQTFGGHDTLMLSMGPAPGAGNVPAVVFTGGVHAREWIAAEFVYLLAEYLVRHYTAAPVNRYQRMIKDLIDTRRIYILPMLNPDGNLYTVFTAAGAGRMWRKNRRMLETTPAAWVNLLTNGGLLGVNPPPFENVVAPAGGGDATYDVPNYDPKNGIPPAPVPVGARVTRTLANGAFGVDPNRNCTTPAWGYNGQRFWWWWPWAEDTSAYDPTQDPYFGPAVASEAETRNLELALAHAAAAPGIAASIDYHSYGQVIIFPSETAHNGAVDAGYDSLGKGLRQLVRSQGALDYKLGTPRQLIGYDATATIIDRAAQAHQSRAFTIELDPASAPGDGAGGFLLPEAQIITVFEKNIRGALALLNAPRAGTAVSPPFPNHQALINAISMNLQTWIPYGRGNQLPL